jgi:excisionase family DNA binding protein
MEKLLTPEQAAEVLQITPKTVRQYITSGSLPAAKMGRVWRIDQKDLRDFIEKQKQRDK